MPRTTGYSTILSLGTLLSTECRTCFTNVLPMHLCCKSLFFSFLEGRPCNYPHLYRRGGQRSDQPVAYCPARPPELTHLLTIHLFPHSSTRTSSSNSIFTLLLLCSPSYQTPWLVHRNFLPKFLSSYTFSLSSNSFDDFSRLPLCTSHLRLLLLSSLHFKIINSPPCYHSPSLITPTCPPFRRRQLRIVLRFFGDCPRAGLFAATTLSRFWNSVATYAWLGLALAVSCAFYAVFASPSQDKLSGL